MTNLTTAFNFVSRRVALDDKGADKLTSALSNGLPENAIEYIDADDAVTTIENAKFWRRLPFDVSLEVPSIDTVLNSETGKDKVLAPLLATHIYNLVRSAFDDNLAIGIPESFSLSIDALIESLEPKARAKKAKSFRITNKLLKQIIESFTEFLLAQGKKKQGILFQVNLLQAKFEPSMLAMLSDAQIAAITDNVLNWSDSLAGAEKEELSKAIELLLTNLAEAVELQTEVSADDL